MTKELTLTVMQQQINELQERIAYHEDTIDSLSKTVVDQEKALKIFEMQLKALNKKIENKAQQGNSSDTNFQVDYKEDVPPHY